MAMRDPLAFHSVPDLPLQADDLPDGLVVVGADGAIRQVNSAAARLLRRPAALLVGSVAASALPFTDTNGRSWWDCHRPFTGLATRTAIQERLVMLPGEHEVMLTAGLRRAAPSGVVTAVLLQLRATDARRRAEAEHATLITMVAHELRSPLTSVKGFTSTLLRRWDRFTDEQKLLMLETVEADADRVTRLISELLDISRVDAGRLQLRRRPVDLLAVARRHVERAVAAGQSPDRFAVVAAEPFPEAWVDPDRLDQILGNLVENAVRHGAGRVTVTLQVLPAAPAGAGPPAAVSITVDDEGPGIDEEHLPHLFAKFWRGSHRSGTGLGLYVVRGLVEAHGGQVSAGRAPSGGARFRVVLPATAPSFHG